MKRKHEDYLKSQLNHVDDELHEESCPTSELVSLSLSKNCHVWHSRHPIHQNRSFHRREMSCSPYMSTTDVWNDSINDRSWDPFYPFLSVDDMYSEASSLVDEDSCSDIYDFLHTGGSGSIDATSESSGICSDGEPLCKGCALNNELYSKASNSILEKKLKHARSSSSDFNSNSEFSGSDHLLLESKFGLSEHKANAVSHQFREDSHHQTALEFRLKKQQQQQQCIPPSTMPAARDCRQVTQNQQKRSQPISPIPQFKMAAASASSSVKRTSTPVDAPQLHNAVRIPAEVVAEMYSHIAKNARLKTEFVPKYDTVQYLLGVPWLEEPTKEWIRGVLALQLVASGFSGVSATATALSHQVPRYMLAFIVPLLILHHVIGYSSFAKRSFLLSATYCVTVIIVAALQGTDLGSSLRSLKLSSDEDLSFYIVSIISNTFGLIANLSLFFSAAALYIRMRHEESEMRVLIPIEILEETPNELPFLRWYFSLPKTNTSENYSNVHDDEKSFMF